MLNSRVAIEPEAPQAAPGAPLIMLDIEKGHRTPWQARELSKLLARMADKAEGKIS